MREWITNHNHYSRSDVETLRVVFVGRFSTGFPLDEEDAEAILDQNGLDLDGVYEHNKTFQFTFESDVLVGEDTDLTFWKRVASMEIYDVDYIGCTLR